MSVKVLIVDDNKDFRETMKNYLAKLNMAMNIADADSAESALLINLRHPADIILLDCRLPGMSGLKAAEIIKKETPNCDIILLSMYDLEGYMNMKNNYVAGYIDKSSIYEQLPVLLKNLLAKRAKNYEKQKN